MVEAAQRQEIGPGLGASEIPAASGLDPFKSPLQLWLEKTGQCEPFAGNDVTEWGLEVEQPLLRWYEARHVRSEDGESMRRPASSLYRDDPSWARATPDAIVSSKNGNRVVQAKNVGHRMLHRWHDGPPDWVVCQVQFEMLVTAYHRGDVIASLGGTPPEVYTVWRDEQMIADLLAIGEAFMRCVEKRTEPKTTHHEDWAAYLARRAKSRGFIVPAESVDVDLVEEWRMSTAALKDAEKRSDLAKNRVRRYLADSNADGMETAYGLATWKETKRVNTDGSVSRALRAPKGFGADGDK